MYVQRPVGTPLSMQLSEPALPLWVLLQALPGVIFVERAFSA